MFHLIALHASCPINEIGAWSEIGPLYEIGTYMQTPSSFSTFGDPVSPGSPVSLGAMASLASMASLAYLVLPYKGPIAAQGPYGLGHIRSTKSLKHIRLFFFLNDLR